LLLLTVFSFLKLNAQTYSSNYLEREDYSSDSSFLNINEIKGNLKKIIYVKKYFEQKNNSTLSPLTSQRKQIIKKTIKIYNSLKYIDIEEKKITTAGETSSTLTRELYNKNGKRDFVFIGNKIKYAYVRDNFDRLINIYKIANTKDTIETTLFKYSESKFFEETYFSNKNKILKTTSYKYYPGGNIMTKVLVQNLRTDGQQVDTTQYFYNLLDSSIVSQMIVTTYISGMLEKRQEIFLKYDSSKRLIYNNTFITNYYLPHKRIDTIHVEEYYYYISAENKNWSACIDFFNDKIFKVQKRDSYMNLLNSIYFIATNVEFGKDIKYEYTFDNMGNMTRFIEYRSKEKIVEINNKFIY